MAAGEEARQAFFRLHLPGGSPAAFRQRTRRYQDAVLVALEALWAEAAARGLPAPALSEGCRVTSEAVSVVSLSLSITLPVALAPALAQLLSPDSLLVTAGGPEGAAQLRWAVSWDSPCGPTVRNPVRFVRCRGVPAALQCSEAALRSVLSGALGLPAECPLHVEPFLHSGFPSQPAITGSWVASFPADVPLRAAVPYSVAVRGQSSPLQVLPHDVALQRAAPAPAAPAAAPTPAAAVPPAVPQPAPVPAAMPGGGAVAVPGAAAGPHWLAARCRRPPPLPTGLVLVLPALRAPSQADHGAGWPAGAARLGALPRRGPGAGCP